MRCTWWRCVGYGARIFRGALVVELGFRGIVEFDVTVATPYRDTCVFGKPEVELVGACPIWGVVEVSSAGSAGCSRVAGGFGIYLVKCP